MRFKTNIISTRARRDNNQGPRKKLQQATDLVLAKTPGASNGENMSIRLAKREDAAEISELVVMSATRNKDLDFDDRGWARFVQINEPAIMETRICGERHFTLCFQTDSRIEGIITIRDNEKIDQLFVRPSSWRKNIAFRLWNAAKRRCLERGNTGYFWVRSSTMAVPVYRKWGLYSVAAAKSMTAECNATLPGRHGRRVTSPQTPAQSHTPLDFPDALP